MYTCGAGPVLKPRKTKLMQDTVLLSWHAVFCVCETFQSIVFGRVGVDDQPRVHAKGAILGNDVDHGGV